MNTVNNQFIKLKPIQIILIAATVSASFIFYLGTEYSFYANFVIMQSIMLLTLLQLSESKKSYFTIISLAILFVLYLIIIIFRVAPVLVDTNNIVFLTKLIILTFVLITIHPPSDDSVTMKFLSILGIIVIVIWNIIELFSMFYMTRAD